MDSPVVNIQAGSGTSGNEMDVKPDYMCRFCTKVRFIYPFQIASMQFESIFCRGVILVAKMIKIE